MANKILIKRSNVAGQTPSTGQLDLGELAINTYDGRLYAKKNDGTASIVDLTQNDPIRLLGDASSTYVYDQSTHTSNVTLTLNTVNPNVGTFGGIATGVITVPQITVDAKGRITAVTTATFNTVGELGTMSSQNANSVAITGGTIDGTVIGGTDAAAGTFTNLTVENNLTLDNGATVTGDLDVTGDVETSGNVTVNGKLFSNDITASSVTVDGDAIITGNLTVQGVTTTVNSTTVAVGDLNITLAKDAENSAQADGAGLTINGPTTPATIIYSGVDDSWNVNKDFNVTGSLSSDGLNVSGGVSFNSTISASGAASFGSNVSIAGVLEVDSDSVLSGNVTVEGNLIVNKKTFLENHLIVSTIAEAGEEGNTYFERVETFFVDSESGDVTALGDISTAETVNAGVLVAGTVQATTIKDSSLTDGRVVLAGTDGELVDDAELAYNPSTDTLSVVNIEIGSNAHIVGTLTVDNQIIVGNLVITGETDLTGEVSLNGVSPTQVVYAGSAGNLQGDAGLVYDDSTNTLTVGNASVVGSFNLTGAATLGDILDVTGLASFSSNVKILSAATYTEDVYTTGALTIAGDASIAKNLQVQTDIRAGGTIYKAGNEVLSVVDTIDGGSY